MRGWIPYIRLLFAKQCEMISILMAGKVLSGLNYDLCQTNKEFRFPINCQFL